MRAREHLGAGLAGRALVFAAAIVALGIAGCGDDGAGGGGGFDVSITPDRTAGNAPMPVAFTAAHRGPLGHTFEFAWDFGDAATSDEQAPSHRFAAPGTYTVRLVVTDADEGGTGEATVDITVSDPADLQVRDVGATPRRTRAGGNVTVAWGLRNEGATVIGTWEQLVFLSPTADFDPTTAVEVARLARTNDAAGTEAGQELDVTLPADLASGDWFLGILADPDERVGDRDRDNNVAFAAAPLQIRNPTEEGPDLAPCGVGIPAFDQLGDGAAPTAELGDQLDVTVCVTNTGNKPVASFGYALYLSRDEVVDEGDAPVGLRGGIALGAGDRETFADLIDLATDLAPGDWRLLVRLDPEDAVGEKLEDNNERGWPGTFTLAPPGEVEGVDLVVSRFAVADAPERLFWGQSLAAELVITNRGDAGVERFFVAQVMAEPIDGRAPVQVASANVPRIDARAETPISVPIRITRRVPEGDYRLVAVVDPTNGVGDVNPGNNRRVLQQVLRLGGEPNVDAAVRQVTFSPGTVDAGDPLTVDAVIVNNGADTTGALEGVVYLSPSAAIGPDSVVVDRFDVESLDGGETRPIEREVTVPVDLDQQVGAWFVGVLLDPEDRLSGELDEANNVAFADGSLVVEGAMGGCAEDAQFEDNDVAARASAVAAGEYSGLGLCDDADWFRIDVPAGQVLEASIAWAAAEGSLMLALADGDGDVLREGEGPAGTARVFTEAAGEERTRLLRVTGAGARLAYDLEVALSPADDRPDLRARAVTPVPAVVRPGAPIALGFEVANTGGGDAPATRAAVHLVAGEVFDAGAPLLGHVDVPAVAAGATVAVQGMVTVPEGTADGRYRLFVSADADAAVEEPDDENNRASAALRVDAVQACEADALEPNRSPLGGGGAPASAPVPPGVHANLTTCREDDDWYAVELNAAERLDVSVTFTAADGDLDLELYDADGLTVIDRSAGLQNAEAVQLLRAPAAGRYFVRVFLAAGAASVSNTYAMTVTVAPADQCADDRFEPNGDAGAATLLPDGMHALTLCPGDEDWFRFNIPAGNTVSFQLAGGAAGVRLALFAPDGELIEEDGRRIVHEATSSGFHRLRVSVGAAAEPVAYQLTVAGVSGVDLEMVAVRLAPAEAAAGGDVRATVDMRNARADGADGVVVRFWLSADDRPSADDVVLAEHRVARIEGGAELALRQRLTIPADAPAGQRFIVADLDPDRRLPDLRPGNNRGAAAIAIVPACVDDDPRDNEGPRTATPLEAADGAHDGGVICAFTEDWYALPVDAAGRVTVRLTFDAAAGDLDLFVYGEDGESLLGESRTEGAPESVTVDVEVAGTVLVRVDGFLEAEGDYRLEWVLP